MSWPAPFDDGELRRMLGVETTLRRVPRGARVGSPGVDADVVVALEGAFSLHADERWVRGVEAPVTSGLDAWLADRPWRFERRATQPMLYAAVSRQALAWAATTRPAIAARLARCVAREACALRCHEAARARGYDDCFAAGPGARVAPGPHAFDPFDTVVAVMAEDPARLRATLPAGLSLASDGRYLLVAAFLSGHDEIAVFVPVTSVHGSAGLFAVELYPNAAMPVVLGREVYGLPKRLGRIERRGSGFDLVVNHRQALCMRFGAARPTDAVGFDKWVVGNLVDSGFGVADARVLVEKRVASAAPCARPMPAIHQLIELPLDDVSATQFELLEEATVEFAENALALGGELRAAARFRLGFVLGDGRIQHDYVMHGAR